MHIGEDVDEINFVCYACMLTCLKLTYNGTDMDRLIGHYQEKAPGLDKCVCYLSENIAQIGFNDGFSTFKSLVFLFDTFNFWSTHTIIYMEQEFRSMNEVLDFYPDIHTWAAPPRA